MTVVDANIPLYAYNADAPQHTAAAQWLTNLFESGEIVALPSVTLWAFVRISTNPRIWPNPMSAQQAFSIVSEWLAQPSVIVLEPGTHHWQLLQRLVVEHKAAGPMVTDAVLAALALENCALLASTDQDFSRFSGLRWINPLSS